jgi:hypothetical protein
MTPAASAWPPAAYVGITGIVTEDDVETVRQAAAIVRTRAPHRRLMAGVLVSWKTLCGRSTTNRRYPTLEAAGRLVEALVEAGAWPVVHYNSREPHLGSQVVSLLAALPWAGGVQLNVVRPEPDEIAQIRRFHPPSEMEIILQANHAAPWDAEAGLLAWSLRFEGLVQHILLDLSGGRGTGIDPGKVAAVLGHATGRWLHAGIRPALAGGLGPDCARVLRETGRQIGAPCQPADPHGGSVVLAACSCDAESGVRVPVDDPVEGEPFQDRLDRGKALAYVEAALGALKAEET